MYENLPDSNEMCCWHERHPIPVRTGIGCYDKRTYTSLTPCPDTAAPHHSYFDAGRAMPSFSQRFFMWSIRFCVSGCDENIFWM